MDLSVLSDISQFPLLYAFVIGQVTTTMPCPLSANVTAIAYVSSTSASSKDAIIAGTVYTIGRADTYGIPGLFRRSHTSGKPGEPYFSSTAST